MVAIINKPGFGEVLGQSLGTGLGQGLQSGVNTGLNMLINQRVNDIAQRNLQQRLGQGLQPIFGEQAQQYSQLPIELLKPAVQEKLKSSQRLESTGPGFKLIAPGLSDEQAEKIGSLPPGVQQIWYRSYIDNPKAAKEALNQATPQELARIRSMSQEQLPIQQQEELSNLQQMAQPQNRLQALQPQQKPSLQEQLLGSLPGLASGIGTRFGIPQVTQQPTRQVMPSEEPSLAEIQEESKVLTIKQLMQENNIGHEEAKTLQKEALKQNHELIKDSNKYKDALNAYNTAADESDKYLNKMENLIKHGSLPVSAFYKLFQKLEDINPAYGAAALGAAGGHVGGLPGAAIGAATGGLIGPIASLLSSAQRGITSTDTEEFEKLSSSFIREAKSIFGSRITDADLNAFLKMIPTLAQSDNGKLAIINNMRAFNDGNKIRHKYMVKILKANKGQTPPNLQLLIDEAAKKELDDSAKKFLFV